MAFFPEPVTNASHPIIDDVKKLVMLPIIIIQLYNVLYNVFFCFVPCECTGIILYVVEEWPLSMVLPISSSGLLLWIGSNSLGGFREGSSANKGCRQCNATRYVKTLVDSYKY